MIHLCSLTIFNAKNMTKEAFLPKRHFLDDYTKELKIERTWKCVHLCLAKFGGCFAKFGSVMMNDTLRVINDKLGKEDNEENLQ